jgi:hypothetical protein
VDEMQNEESISHLNVQAKKTKLVKRSIISMRASIARQLSSIEYSHPAAESTNIAATIIEHYEHEIGPAASRPAVFPKPLQNQINHSYNDSVANLLTLLTLDIKPIISFESCSGCSPFLC